MIEKKVWIVLYSIIIFGFIYFGVHFAIFLNKPDQSVYQELRKELGDPTPRAEYMAKYKKFLERKETPSSGSSQNINHIPSSLNGQESELGLNSNKKAISMK